VCVRIRTRASSHCYSKKQNPHVIYIWRMLLSAWFLSRTAIFVCSWCLRYVGSTLVHFFFGPFFFAILRPHASVLRVAASAARSRCCRVRVCCQGAQSAVYACRRTAICALRMCVCVCACACVRVCARYAGRCLQVAAAASLIEASSGVCYVSFNTCSSRSLSTCSRSLLAYSTSAYVSIRQHTSAYVSIRRVLGLFWRILRQHTSAYVSIRQHTSAYDVF
jgi:hypothetical protein